MASVNKVILMGRLGADPELRYTQNQTAVATLSLATSEFRMGQDGQRQEMTEWHRVVVWNKQAENCARYLQKGAGVFVEGRLQTRSWEDQSGQKKYSTEIVAQNVQFLPRANQPGPSQDYSDQQPGSDFGGGGGFPGAGGQGGGGGGSQFSDQGGGFPQAQPQQQQKPAQPNMPAASSIMDDIPF